MSNFPACVEDDVVITIDARLAYRDNMTSEWTTKFHSVEQRPLTCTFAVSKVNLHDSMLYTEMKNSYIFLCLVRKNSVFFFQTYENEGRFYHCDPIPFMELGSVAHKYFLMNLRLPVNDTMNVGIGEIKDIHVVVSIISTC